MSTQSFQHLVAAPYTPLKADGTVNFDMIAGMATYYRRNRVTGVFLCGTTGEGKLLSLDERKQVLEAWSNTEAGLRVLVQVGCDAVEDSRQLARHAQQCGVDGIAAIAPASYNPTGMTALAQYCTEVAAAAPETPFMYYHIPITTGVDYPMIEFLPLLEERVPTLAGMKYSHHDLMDFMQCLRYQNGKYEIFYGKDEFLLGALAMGCTRVVGSTYNYASPVYWKVIEAFEKNDLEEARLWQSRAHAVLYTLRQYHEIAAGKALMKALGVDCGPTRLPIEAMDAQTQQEIVNALKSSDVFQYLSH